ncbi:MAG: EAL domain-containing protein [Rhodocyclaceae bacterium]|nr:EAL domain-containing protein [Rhodocyclaceae bacterium]
MYSLGEDIFIGRQPILDRDQNLFAYELLFRSCNKSNSAQVHDDLTATASVLSHAFSEFGVEQALGPYKGFVNCDASLLLSDLPELLPAEKVVLEILETVEVTPEIVARCAELKKQGFTLALDDFIDDIPKWEPLINLVDIVKVDLMLLDQDTLSRVTQELKRWPVKLLAEKVDSAEQAAFCHQLGYDLFQGYYFAKPTIISGRKLGQSQVTLVRLMSLILSDAETADLEAAFKQHPGLTMNLLKLTNSVSTGVKMKVTSLRHAITVLGRRQLQRWLQLVLYTSQEAGSAIPGPLMHLAATRGRFLELLAERMPKVNRDFEDNAFITGIMSLMPTLMSASMEDILQGMPLDPSIMNALLAYEGELGTMLALAQALESVDPDSCQSLTAMLHLDAEAVNTCQSQALAWAGNIGIETS